MKSNAVSAALFNMVAEQHCHRWEKRSLNVARALLVESEKQKDVADKFGMSVQQASVIKQRFEQKLEKHKETVITVSVAEFMENTPPAGGKTLTLDVFIDDITQLVKAGYSQEQIAEFLQKNSVSVSADEISTFIGAIKQ